MPETRFVVLCTQRTGSNYLCSLLSSHPKILCHRAALESQPWLDITYEGVVAGGDVPRVLSFLGLPAADSSRLTSPFVRQSSSNLRDCIPNLDELESALAGTKYERDLTEALGLDKG